MMEGWKLWVKGLSLPEVIPLALYFTACHKVVELCKVPACNCRFPVVDYDSIS